MKTRKRVSIDSLQVHSHRPKIIRRLALHTAIVAAIVSGGYSRQSYAGSCTGGPVNFVCANAADSANDVAQSISGTDLVVTTSDGFGLDVSSGPALRLTASGNLVFNDTHQAAITISDGLAALVANNNGAGAVTITTTGSVAGIFSTNYSSSGTDLSINAADITGNGAYIVNNGSGTLSFNAGNVAGASRGLTVRNQGTDLLIETINISSVDGAAISAVQNGSGSLSINAGTITAGNDGINASVTSNATDTVITSANITAGGDGVRVLHAGSGSLSITNAGTITAGNDGVRTNSNATNTVITSANITAGGYGVLALHSGSNGLSITSTGTIISGESGIYALTGSSATDTIITVADINADLNGIDADHAGSGDLIITATGTVTASEDGIHSTTRNSATDTIITVADIDAGDDGIDAGHDGSGDLIITGTGTISANDIGIVSQTTENSINHIINVGEIYARNQGLNVEHHGSGQLSITTGNVLAGDRGIYALAESAATDLIINTGEVAAGNYTIQAYNYGSGQISITSTGRVTSFNDQAIKVGNASAGTDIRLAVTSVDAENEAIRVANQGTGITTITSTGTITANAGIYVEAANLAGDIIVNANTINASGFGIYAENRGTGELTITTTGNVASDSGDGIYALNDIDTSALSIHVSEVGSSDKSISARNMGTGATIITASGTVSSLNSDAISVFSAYSSTGTSIAATEVSGNLRGIVAYGKGSGALSITSTGSVVGVYGDGIIARKYGSGDLTIETNGVSGGDNGIYATSFSDGALAITDSNAVTGDNGSGIKASVNNTGTDLTIAAVDVTGNQYGIKATNEGAGGLIINTSGTVTGENNFGIDARNNYGTDLVIAANNVTGAGVGINAINLGTGSLSVTTAGTVSGASLEGIFAYQSDSGSELLIQANNVTGAEAGINAINLGSGSLSITTTGAVSGEVREGIFAYQSGIGSDLLIQSNNVTGAEAGINAINRGKGSLSITTTGAVNGQLQDGLYANQLANGTGLTINANNVLGAKNGIKALHYGSGALTITATGNVEGRSKAGIQVANYGSTGPISIEANQVSGGSYGIEVNGGNSSSISIATTGAVSTEGNTALYVFTQYNSAADAAGDITINTVDVSSRVSAIFVEQGGTGGVAITSTGSAYAQLGEAIAARNASHSTGDISVNAMNADGGYNGINASQRGTGNLAITATGDVVGRSIHGIQANNQTNAGDINISANNVSGYQNGIEVDAQGVGSVSISATGTVNSETGKGINAYVGNTGTGLTINAANISADNKGVEVRNYGSGTTAINSTGTITGNLGIDVATGTQTGDIIINAHNIDANGNGINAQNHGTGQMTITASGSVSSVVSEGVYAYNGTGATDLTLHVNTVSGDLSGIEVINNGTGMLTIDTIGSVTATDGNGISATTRATATDLAISTAADVTGGVDGIHVAHNGTGEITLNTNGTVTGQSGHALLLTRNAAVNVGGTITNSGLLVSESQAAVMMDNGFNFTGSFVNQGVIAGGNGVALDASATSQGFKFTQAGGEVHGDILLGSGDDSIVIQGGLINGDIVGQGRGEVIFDVVDGNSLGLHSINNVSNYIIRSGRVNQSGPFSTTAATTIESGATMAFADEIRGSGALVSSGELVFVVDGINAGKLVQSGTVTLNDGSLITLESDGLALGFDSSFELINATALIDNGAQIEDSSSLLFDFELVVDSSTVTANTSVADLGRISSIRNASAFGDAVAAQARLDRNFDNIAVAHLATLSASDVLGFEQVADSLSPSVSGAISNSAKTGNNVTRAVLRDRLQVTSGQPTMPANALWLKGFTSTHEFDGTEQVAGFKADTNGVLVGADHQWDQWLVGGALAMSVAEANNDRFAKDSISTDSTQLIVYGSYQQSKWLLHGAGSYTLLDFEMDRVNLIAAEDDIEASTIGSLMGLNAGVSYSLEPVRGIYLQPQASVLFSSLSVDGFTEQGGLNLSVEYDSRSTLGSELGVAATTKPIALGKGWSIVPQINLSWSHEFLAEEEQLSAGFDQQRFIQQGYEPSQDALNILAEAEFFRNNGLRIRLDYRGTLGRDFTEHQGAVGVNYAF